MLRFSPTAWAKLLFFRDYGDTEIGGFGVTAEEDPLYVEEFVTVSQNVSVVSVSFEDEAVADFFDDRVDQGRRPEQFARLWLHTHPGDSPSPSPTDSETFARVFGSCDWAVMFILGKRGKTYAKLRFNTGPGGEMLIPVEVDYSKPFGPTDRESWEIEYFANIKPLDHFVPVFGADDDWREDIPSHSVPDDWLEELEEMEPEERQLVLGELSARPDLWEGSGVFDAL